MHSCNVCATEWGAGTKKVNSTETTIEAACSTQSAAHRFQWPILLVALIPPMDMCKQMKPTSASWRPLWTPCAYTCLQGNHSPSLLAIIPWLAKISCLIINWLLWTQRVSWMSLVSLAPLFSPHTHQFTRSVFYIYSPLSSITTKRMERCCKH